MPTVLENTGQVGKGTSEEVPFQRLNFKFYPQFQNFTDRWHKIKLHEFFFAKQNRKENILLKQIKLTEKKNSHLLSDWADGER